MDQNNGNRHRTSDNRKLCVAKQLGINLLNSLNSPISRGIKRALKDGHDVAVSDAVIDPNSYSNTDDFYRDYQAVSLLSKFPDLNLGINRTEIALGKFHSAELVCATTNQRLRKRTNGTSLTRVSAEGLFLVASRKISELLGVFDWNNVAECFGFSGGASTRLPRRIGDPYYKISGKPHVTSNCYHLGIAAIRSSPSWHALITATSGPDPKDWFTIVPGNKLTTVAKNAKTDRVIAIEPCMNMYIQKGIGQVIRAKLKRYGIDLNDQTRNQRLAQVGSEFDSYATIDLAAASDSLSVELCHQLLPAAWFHALMLCRSPRGTLPDGSVIQYEKISSMGNGFTFELESLIFWALSSAVMSDGEVDGQLSVYGDDIIVPKSAAGFVIELLQYCGFSTNIEKTYCNGPFRESCGNHYFRGADVTPFYIRKPIRSTARLLWYCNSLRRWSSRLTPGKCDPRFLSSYLTAVRMLPSSWQKPRIPDGIGDGALIGSFMEVDPVREKRSSKEDKPYYCGWTTRQLVLRDTEETQCDNEIAYIKKIMLWPEEGNRLTAKCDSVKYKEQRLVLTQWVDPPSWSDLLPVDPVIRL